MLSGSEIIKQVEMGNINITPFKKENINPNSYNVTIGKEIFRYNHYNLDSKKEQTLETIEIPEQGYTLKPGVIYLMPTEEIVGSKKFIPVLMGRSSYGRLGLNIICNAGLGDVGFEGKYTLQLSVVQPLTIYANTQVAQLCFFSLIGDNEMLYNSKYQGAKGVMKSMAYKDFK